MRLLSLLTAVVCYVLSISVVDAIFKIQPDEVFNFPELIASRGKVLQRHKVVTEDGYIITLDRIMNPEDVGKSPLKKKPVILFHGIWCQSSVFFVNSPDEAESGRGSKYGNNLGFGVLDAGFDVWVPNARGNGVSDEHVNLTTYNTKFWEFSYMHIGMYDIPAFLDYILKVTGYETVGWVGYSQGGQSLWAKLTFTPELANKIHPFIGMAATSFMGRATSKYFWANQLIRPFLAALPMPYPFSEPLINWITQGICRPEFNFLGLPKNGTTFICKIVLDLMFGANHNIDQRRLPVYMHFLPKRCSSWQMVHILQAMKSGKWQAFDYDDGHILKGRNMKMYGSPKAPEYDWKKISKNLTAVMFYGNLDALNTPEDAMELVNLLRSNGVNVTGVQVEGDWNHYDFLGGVGAGVRLYDPVIKVLLDNVRDDFKG